MSSAILNLANHSQSPFHGWVRRTIDQKPPFMAGQWKDGSEFVIGDENQQGVRAIDVFVDLPAGGRKTLVLADAFEAAHTMPPWDPGIFGGPMRFNSVAMELVSYKANGAAIESLCRVRAGRTLCLDVWTRWYPGEWYARAEALLVSSNPSVPDMFEGIGDAVLTFGNSVPVVVGAGFAPLLKQGDWLFDGQGRCVPVIFAWPDMLGGDPVKWMSLQAVQMVGGNGLSGPLYPQGTPRLPANFNGAKWAIEKFDPSVHCLNNWEQAPLGPNRNSGDTGSQEDQCFVGAEALVFPGAEIPNYYCSLKLAERPTQHREADGTMLDLARHPQLSFWGGRVNMRISPDKLGKAGEWDYWQAHQCGGPDVEHSFWFRLIMSDRFVDSPAQRYLLQQLVRTYLLTNTAAPGLITSQTWAARAMGWEAAMVLLMKRVKGIGAEQMVSRWRERMVSVILPQLKQRGQWWDTRVDDPRLGPGVWAIAWQQAVGAYWLDVLCQEENIPEGRELCVIAAQAIVDRAWKKLAIPAAAASAMAVPVPRFISVVKQYSGGFLQNEDGTDSGIAARAPALLSLVANESAVDTHVTDQWVCAPQLAVDPNVEPAMDGSFNFFGMCMAPAVLLRNGVSNEKTQELWRWLVDHCTDEGKCKWLPPELP